MKYIKGEIYLKNIAVDIAIEKIIVKKVSSKYKLDL